MRTDMALRLPDTTDKALKILCSLCFRSRRPYIDEKGSWLVVIVCESAPNNV